MLATDSRALREHLKNFIKWYVELPSGSNHRFESFVYRYIDGHDYMWAVPKMLDNASDLISTMVRSSDLMVVVWDGRHDLYILLSIDAIVCWQFYCCKFATVMIKLGGPPM